MQSANFRDYFHLHILIFIAGFTAILGELITIEAISLVWFRMLMASILLVVYLLFSKVNLKVNPKAFLRLSFALANAKFKFIKSNLLKSLLAKSFCI